MKITQIVGNITLEIEGENLEHMVQQCRDFERLIAPAIDPASVRPPAGQSKEGTPVELLAWLRAEGDPHAMSWIKKHSGFKNAAKLCSELERTGKLSWHECLYTTDKGVLRTMRGAFIDGLEPEHETDAHDDQTVLQWIKEHPGYALAYVEKCCGVVKSRAVKAVNRLLKASEIELREDPENPKAAYKAFLVE